MICSNYLLFYRLLLYLVDGFPLLFRAFEFDLVPLVDFCFCCLCFGCQIQKIIAKVDVKELALYLLFWEFYSFRSYIQISNLFWVNLCMWYRIGVQFHALTSGFHFPSTIYWKDCPLPIVYSWKFCCKLIDHICMGLFMGPLFCSTDLCVYFYISTILFWLL